MEIPSGRRKARDQGKGDRVEVRGLYKHKNTPVLGEPLRKGAFFVVLAARRLGRRLKMAG